MTRTEPDPRPSNLGLLLASAADARPEDHLVIAGGGIDLAIDLMHQGFAHVACARPGHPLVGEDPDVLLIPHAGSTADLARILGGLGRRLHASGTVALYDRRLPTRQRLAALQDLLARYGFGALVRQRSALGTLLTVRKLATAPLVSAA
jgi:hypothetical protein